MLLLLILLALYFNWISIKVALILAVLAILLDKSTSRKDKLRNIKIPKAKDE